MSQEIEDSIEDASTEELGEIDEILEEADPEFINQLKSISAENLNHQDIGLPTEEEVLKKDRWFYRFWFGLDTGKQLLVVLGAFIVFVALPLILLSVLGIFTPSFLIARQTSFENWADEMIVLDSKVKQKDLMELFLTDQFFLEIPEQVFPIKPRADIRIGRFAFYMELLDRQNVPYFESHYEEIIEILGRTLKQYTFEDFKGIEGKEEMRKILLASLNSKLQIKIKNIRYKLLVF